jgi:hypothetical protein
MIPPTHKELILINEEEQGQRISKESVTPNKLDKA